MGEIMILVAAMAVSFALAARMFLRGGAWSLPTLVLPPLLATAAIWMIVQFVWLPSDRADGQAGIAMVFGWLIVLALNAGAVMIAYGCVRHWRRRNGDA